MARGVFVFVGIAAIFLPPLRAADPSFADRPLSEWVADLSAKDPLVREEAIDVLMKIGSDARAVLPRLTEMYQNDSSQGVRRRAALALWRLNGKTEAAREILAADLKTGLPLQRLQAISQLRQLGVSGRELTPQILPFLTDLDATVSSLALTVLHQMGDDAIPMVVAALPKSSAAKRDALLSFLQRLVVFSPAAESALRSLLADRDPIWKLAAIRTLWPVEGEHADTLAELQKLLNGAASKDAVDVALNLPRKAKDLEPFYRGLLKDADATIRVRAAEALWELDPKSLKEGLPVLIAGLKETNREPILAAVGALTRIGPEGKAAIPELTDLAKSVNYRIDPAAAVRALGQMGPDAVDPLLEMMSNPAFQFREPALHSLSMIGPVGIAKIAPALADRNLYVRQMAYRAVQFFGPAAKGALPQLTDGLKENDANLRHQAVQRIGQIGPSGEKAVPGLLALAADPRQMEPIRTSALEAIAQIGPRAKGDLGDLPKLLKDASPAVRFRAAEAMYRTGGNPVEAVAVILEFARAGRYFNALHYMHAIPVMRSVGVSSEELAASLLQGLKSGNVADRNSIAVGLQDGPPDKAFLPILDQLAEDQDGNVRFQTALALARYDSHKKAAIAILGIALMPSPAFWREEQTLKTLEELGSAARELHPRLMNQFRSEFDAQHKIRLAEVALAIDREKSASALEWLREQLEAADPTLRMAAARVVAKFDGQNPTILKFLLIQAEDAHSAEGAKALACLGLLGANGKAATELLHKAAKGTDGLRRVRAAFSLWQLGGKADEIVPILTAALTETQTSPHSNVAGYYVAAQAATALGEMGSAASAALPALREAKTNGDLMLSTAATSAIRKIESAK